MRCLWPPRDSVSQRLWAGTLNPGSSVTINGLSACKVIGLEFKDGNGQVFPVVLKSGDVRFAATQFVPEVADWDVQDWGGWFAVSGTTLTLKRCSIMLSRATAVGNGFTAAGYSSATPVTAVWRIL